MSEIKLILNKAGKRTVKALLSNAIDIIEKDEFSTDGCFLGFVAAHLHAISNELGGDHMEFDYAFDGDTRFPELCKALQKGSHFDWADESIKPRHLGRSDEAEATA